jgi:sarcosine oxidase
VPPDADIVVVGAGIVGVATARALAGQAGSVVLLEQFELAHDRGSSHGTSRIFRLNYPDTRLVRLAMAADTAWRELEAERGETLIERVGCLDVGAAAAATGRALAACGVACETLSAEAVRERWPLRLESGETAVFQPEGGVTLADRAYAALLSEALEGGVETREHTAVAELVVGPRDVRLTTPRGELTARAVVVTAGAWAPRLLAPAGISLPVVPTRETVVYLDLPGAGDVPPVIDYASRPSAGEGGVSRAGQAAYALAAPGTGLKAGLHQSGPVTDPDDVPEPDEGIATWVEEWAGRRYGALRGRLRAETCLYTNTADEGFVLERHGRVVVGSACSGHGFKFAPVVGRTLAVLAREAAD